MTDPRTSLSVVQVPHLRRDVEREGFAVIPGVVDDRTIDFLIADIDHVAGHDALRRRAERLFGVRDIVNLVPSARAVAHSDGIRAIARTIVAEGPILVRSLFFDKGAAGNWPVAWHQDRTIAVSCRIEVDGFSSWTVKGGLPHVQPPDHVLEEMITLRIHLDNADESNGALKVIPGSHRLGRLSPPQIRDLTHGGGVTCAASRGSILVMRPLLLHSSPRSASNGHRRVVHLEFAGAGLSGGLAWN